MTVMNELNAQAVEVATSAHSTSRAIYETGLGPNHPFVAGFYNLATLLRIAGAPKEALGLLEPSAGIYLAQMSEVGVSSRIWISFCSLTPRSCGSTCRGEVATESGEKSDGVRSKSSCLEARTRTGRTRKPCRISGLVQNRQRRIRRRSQVHWRPCADAASHRREVSSSPTRLDRETAEISHPRTSIYRLVDSGSSV